MFSRAIRVERLAAHSYRVELADTPIGSITRIPAWIDVPEQYRWSSWVPGKTGTVATLDEAIEAVYRAAPSLSAG